MGRFCRNCQYVSNIGIVKRVLTSKLIHFPPEQDLRLHLPVFDGDLVKVLEYDATAGYLAFTGRLRSGSRRLLWGSRGLCS